MNFIIECKTSEEFFFNSIASGFAFCQMNGSRTKKKSYNCIMLIFYIFSVSNPLQKYISNLLAKFLENEKSCKKKKNWFRKKRN